MLGLPCDDNEEVQAVPCVSQIAFFPKNPQRDHLNDHFHGEEGKDEIIEALQKKRREEGCSYIVSHLRQGGIRDLSPIRSPLAPPGAKSPRQQQHWEQPRVFPQPFISAAPTVLR